MAKQTENPKLKSINTITNEELEKLNGIQNDFAMLQTSFGQLKVNKLNLERQLEESNEKEIELESLFAQLQKVERETMDELTAKYGNVTLDVKTGQFKENS